MPNITAPDGVALIVREPFDKYQRGDKIEDPSLIEEILNSEQSHYVNAVINSRGVTELDVTDEQVKTISSKKKEK